MQGTAASHLCDSMLFCALLDLCGILFLQKLPFTIPELVQASPCRSTDGLLYTGKDPFLSPLLFSSPCACILSRNHTQKTVWCPHATVPTQPTASASPPLKPNNCKPIKSVIVVTRQHCVSKASFEHAQWLGLMLAPPPSSSSSSSFSYPLLISLQPATGFSLLPSRVLLLSCTLEPQS